MLDTIFILINANIFFNWFSAANNNRKNLLCMKDFPKQRKLIFRS